MKNATSHFSLKKPSNAVESMMDKSVQDIANAESQCIRAVTGGEMRLMFALRKYGLNYTSRGANSQQYNRLRRAIKLAKSKKIAKQSVF